MSQNLDPHLSKICSFTHKCHVASKDMNVLGLCSSVFPTVRWCPLLQEEHNCSFDNSFWLLLNRKPL